MNHNTPLFCQRWRERRTLYRPAGETINPATLDVAPIKFSLAKTFVKEHHYSRSCPAARWQFGLFEHGLLSGVAIFSVPMSSKTLTNVFPGNPRDSIELGRFVLLDSIKANGESWFFARCKELLKREGLRGIIAFADDTARPKADGSYLTVGHLGIIYAATNSLYAGRNKRRIHRLLPNGTILSPRAISKIRNEKKGWRYATKLLIEAGAAPPEDAQPLRPWLDHWLSVVTQPLFHRGNHKYCWGLQRKVIPVCSPQPYPKNFPTAEEMLKSQTKGGE